MTLPLCFMILFSIEHRHILACVHGTAWRRQMYSCHSNSLSPLSVQTPDLWVNTRSYELKDATMQTHHTFVQKYHHRDIITW